jgi:hypothetical protein
VIRNWEVGSSGVEGGGVACIRCLELYPSADLDRLLWCASCVARAKARAARTGWVSGGILALLLAVYIHFGIQPDYALIPAGWAATLAVAFYLGGRVARELAYGTFRIRNQAAVEAAPPRTGPDPASPPSDLNPEA